MHARIASLTATAAVLVFAAAPAVAAGGTSYSTTPSSTAWSVTGGQVYAMVRAGDKIIIGGTFTAVRSPSGTSWPRNRIAMLSASTGAPVTGWDPGANNTIRALATDGTRLWAGGSFTTIGGASRSDLALLSVSTGTVQTAFTANGNGEVRSLYYGNSRLYAGGLFTKIGTTTRTRAAALNPATGALDASWKPVASWAVNSIAPVPGTTSLVLGGEFSTLSTQPRRYLAMVHNTTGAVLPWAPAAECNDPDNPCIVKSVAVTSSMVYAAVAGVGGRVAAYYVSSGARRWVQFGDGDAQVVTLSGTTLFAGGHFDPQFGNGGPRSELAALNSTTGSMLAYSPKVQGGSGIWAMLAGSDGLQIAGSFTMVNGVTARKGYAAFPLG
ncbi:MAG: hypothetical protein JWO79_3676 [Actinomycetia bacterium]|nr:hypothetical protein [Actinomycetes bacterium]